MKRRGFLKGLFGILSAVAAAPFLYAAGKYLAPLAGEAQEKKVMLARSELLPGAVRKFVLNNTPAIVIHHPSRGFIAFTRVCTHLGCLIEYDKDKGRFICPCHAGTFDLDGNVIAGPPPKPLRKFPVRVEDEQIVIG